MPRVTNGYVLRRARKILHVRSNERAWHVLWNHTGFPLVPLRMVWRQLAQYANGKCDCPDCVAHV